MKTMKSKLLVLFSILFLSLPSCDDGDGYSLGDFAVDMATVNEEIGCYSLTGDSWGTLWPAATSIPWYHPADSQRVIVYFNPLQDDFQGYDCAIKVEDVEEILTKKIERLTPENDTEFGNDPIAIETNYIWISGGFLNIRFTQNLPRNQKHRISLVKDEAYNQAKNDGYVHLQVRYNDYDDVTGIYVNGLVSFNLEYPSLSADTKGFKIRVNLISGGETEFVYDFGQQVSTPKNLDFSNKDLE